MKTKLCLIILLAGTLALLSHAYWRVRTMQRTLEFQTIAVKSLAVSHAQDHFKRSSASYFILGKVSRDYVEAFAAHFKDYGITPVATGCIVTEPLQVYSDEYNRMIRELLSAKYGKDIIWEFDSILDQKRTMSRPNKEPVPTPTSVTPPAGQEARQR